MREEREADFIQLQPVKWTVIVATRSDGGGQDDTAGVDSLEDALDIAAASDLFDQDRGEALGPKLFVNAEEVDLDHLDSLAANSEFRRDTANGGN
jgi:hypothetical protein